MNEKDDDEDPIFHDTSRHDDSEEEKQLAKTLIDFEHFTLSQKPRCDLKRKMLLSQILPLLTTGATYDEISDKLDINRSTVYEILKLYHKVVDQNEFLDVYWWSLFFQMVKNKPETAFNALTQLKLKHMNFKESMETDQIVISWMKNEAEKPKNKDEKT